MTQHYFSVGAIFKNEGHILEEWINHYKFHGIDHIYLIDDHSTDLYKDKLQKYIDEKYVTLYCDDIDNEKRWLGMQEFKYNKYFKPIINESKWFGIFDLDEFLYSPKCINVTEILKKHEHCGQINIDWLNFGSSDHVPQPKFVVPNFLYRGEYNSQKNGASGMYNSYKSIVQSHEKTSLGVHQHHNAKYDKLINCSFNFENPELLINHYSVQSKDFYLNIKCTRGDVNYYYDAMKYERNLAMFDSMDTNEVYDTTLYDQNKHLY